MGLSHHPYHKVSKFPQQSQQAKNQLPTTTSPTALRANRFFWFNSRFNSTCVNQPKTTKKAATFY
ncbi:MAG: hypothetical protein IIY05_03795, partial [Alistipes sp.]|nr:hypothetical protein [Alistipes sp.]